MEQGAGIEGVRMRTYRMDTVGSDGVLLIPQGLVRSARACGSEARTLGQRAIVRQYWRGVSPLGSRLREVRGLVPHG